MTALHDLEKLPRWVGWRNEPRDGAGKPTKVPYNAKTGGKARADDPRTWASADRARAWAAQHVNGHGGGIGIELGELGDGTALGGVDFDTCRDPEGNIASWALDCIRDLDTSTEISPSGTGAKAFFLFDAASLPELRED